MPDPPEDEDEYENDDFELPEQEPIDDRWAPDYMDEQ
jgi:hypothetical protein